MTLAMCVPLLIVMLLAAVAPLDVAGMQQRPARDAAIQVDGDGVIAGTVVDLEGKPVRRAIVTLTSSDSAYNTRAAITGDDGQFLFTSLPAGRFSLTATKAGWVRTYYGSNLPGRGPATPLALGEAQTMTGLAVRMARGAVVSGRILDEFGQPQPGMRISVLEYRTVAGRRTLSQVFNDTPFAQTDDRGEYRIFGLAPGNYLLSASAAAIPQAGMRTVSPQEVKWALQQASATTTAGSAPPRPGPAAGYAPVFFPGTFDPLQATTIALAPGDERGGIDFVVRPIAVARIEGAVRRPDGQRLITPQITLRRMSEEIAMSILDATATPRATLDPNGHFVFPAVRPGRYHLMIRAASRPSTPAPRPSPDAAPVPVIRHLDLYASTEIDVQGDDIGGLSLTLQPGVTVAGRLAFEASTLESPTDLSRARIQLMMPEARQPGSAAAVNMYMGLPGADATFSIAGVTPGRYVVSAFMPGGAPPMLGWTVKSVIVNGQNVFDRPFEIRAGDAVADVVITMTDRVTEISGLLQDQLGRPAPDHRVFVIPTDKSAWTLVSARMRPPIRPASDGRYRVAGLPPGEYFVAALADIAEEDYLDASFLEQVAAAAIKITLAEGEKKQLDLRLRGPGM